MVRGKFKGKPTGRRQFSTPEEMVSGFSARPRTFRQVAVEAVEVAEEDEENQREELGDETKGNTEKRKGAEGIIEIENPNLIKSKALKARNVDLGKTTELSRREREEFEKQKARERYMRLQEQGKTDQARKDLDRLALIRQQRAEAAKRKQPGRPRRPSFRSRSSTPTEQQQNLIKPEVLASPSYLYPQTEFSHVHLCNF